LIFTDLDGTLLDHHTYAWDLVRPALKRIKQTQTPLIMVSSKTRLEIETLRQELANSDPFISENGGAIFIPNDYDLSLPSGAVKSGDYHVMALGLSTGKLTQKFDLFSEQFPVKALSRIDVTEVAALTGLSLDQARAAQAREYDEAFILTDKGISEETMTAAAYDLGLQLTRGGRFYHLTGGNDKGHAVHILTDLYRQKQPDLITIGLGDSSNDASLLAAVDRPFLVARPDGSHISMELPGLTRVALAGPAGFNQTIMELLG